MEEGKFGPRRRSEREKEDILRGKIIFGAPGTWRRKRRKMIMRGKNFRGRKIGMKVEGKFAEKKRCDPEEKQR